VSRALEFRLRHRDGSYRDYRNDHPRIWRWKQLGTYAARDITERTRAAEALQESQMRFQMVARATNDVVWDNNLATGRAWWNEAVETVFGYPPGEKAEGNMFWVTRVHADDLEAVVASFGEAVAARRPLHSSEYRFRRADGTYAYVLDRVLVQYGSDGTPVRVFGAMTDITARKHAEEALRQSQQRLQSILDNASVAISMKDAAGLYQIVNRRWEQLYGRSEAATVVSATPSCSLPSSPSRLPPMIDKYCVQERPSSSRKSCPAATARVRICRSSSRCATPMASYTRWVASRRTSPSAKRSRRLCSARRLPPKQPTGPRASSWPT
jgi:PAS domain S-box-containing protein